MMADHLMLYADQPTMLAAPEMAPYLVTQDDGSQIVNPSISMPVTVSVPNTPPATIPPTVQLPGYFVWVSLPEPSAVLQNAPNNACQIIADRDACNAGAPIADWLLYQSPTISAGTLLAAIISPVFAGSNYPFGSV